MMTLLVAFAATVCGAGPSVEVYPSGPSVPENLLRIELRFSAPLNPPLNLHDLKLEDAKGGEIKDPFLDLLLPGRDDKRITILFDPARVKTGIGANLALGRALHAGERVTLVITHPEFARPVRKSWRVTAFDGHPPQPARWTFASPRAGSRSPLVIHLDKPISSTAENMIAIRGPEGERVSGDECLTNGETEWRFTPSRPWKTGTYAVVTHPDLEDVAGNRPSEPFEFKKVNHVSRERETIKSFEISANQ
jgi:hypothetical protein